MVSPLWASLREGRERGSPACTGTTPRHRLQVVAVEDVLDNPLGYSLVHTRRRSGSCSTTLCHSFDQRIPFSSIGERLVRRRVPEAEVRTSSSWRWTPLRVGYEDHRLRLEEPRLSRARAASLVRRGDWVSYPAILRLRIQRGVGRKGLARQHFHGLKGPSR
ncbi:hypothetical protein FA13DRAFT_595435 [Coprinellus micaceus]|uniref:Uncharacterized protein n=1 Tax=Coprinellus micaceus TaxID=71717 RepID=A0A4Y7T764_COPMI|nr:hypothetical protein FA13DRAFT_595435 [Coprinellus micaceus]